MPRQGKIPEWWSIFITEYLKNGNNATEAYLKVKPNSSRKTANVNAAKLLANTKFDNQLSIARKKLEDKCEMSREEWLRLQAEVCRFDIREIINVNEETGDTTLSNEWKDKKGGHALGQIDISTTTNEDGQVFQKVRVKRENRSKAFENIGKALGYMVDKQEITHKGAIGTAKMSRKEIIEFWRQQLGSLPKHTEERLNAQETNPES